MENIRYGKLEASDDEVIQAAKAAHVHRFVQTLPGGYAMELNEEASNVSQGQKQLLTIARAILADPKILILDEATSSVDTRTADPKGDGPPDGRKDQFHYRPSSVNDPGCGPDPGHAGRRYRGTGNP